MRKLFKRTIILVVTLLSVLANSGVATAIGFDEQFYSSNDILFYNPNDNTCTTQPQNSSSVLVGSDELEKIFNYFTGKGLSKEQAAGIIGNISVESGGDPENIQNPAGRTKDPSNISAGWGIIQWTPGSKVIGIAKDANITGPIYELSTQLEIVWWHMNNTSPTGVKNMLEHYKTITDAQEAMKEYEQKMEGAGADTKNYVARSKATALALDQYGGSASTSSASTTTSDGCDTGSGAGAVTGNAVETAINYSWEKYHAPPYTVMKPTYEKAVKDARGKGWYVGGGSKPGIDCGGFITTVMKSSGADPDYNKGKGPTDTQRSYMESSGKYIKFTPTSTADMKPGDIAINSAHTYMYVGKNDGFQTSVASASYSSNGQSWRTPMAGMERPADTSYSWFRLKG